MASHGRMVLTPDAGWDEATAGCTYVHHLASPIRAELPNDPNDLIDPVRDDALVGPRRDRPCSVAPIVVRDELASGALIESAKVPNLIETFYGVTLERRFPNPLLAELMDEVS